MSMEWSDTLKIVGWLAGCALVIGVLVVAGNLFLAWLGRHPKLARGFTVFFAGFALAVVCGISAFVVTFFSYGFHRSRRIWGVDIVPFSTVTACLAGFAIGSTIAWFVVKRITKR